MHIDRASQTIPPPVRVLLADDHPLILTGLHQMLAFEDDLVVVGAATHGEEVQCLAKTFQPDILLLDLILPGPSPQAIATHLRTCSPRTKIVVLSAHDDERYVQDLIALGIVGYVLKNEGGKAIVDAIRTVVRGGTWFSQPVLMKLVQGSSTVQAAIPVATLTEREREVLACIARGYDNREIAATLNISVRTVKYHLKNIYSKLGADSRAKAVAWAWQHGIMERP